MNKRILVIGGGIGGVQAGLDLAQMGIKVTLVEAKPSIGGRMAQLDKTFPTNDCSTCILSPKLYELASHPNVDIFSYSTLDKVVKKENGFQARIRKKARFVNEEKCTACGLCSEKCPVKIPDMFNKEITTTKCISIPYAQAVPAVYKIDKKHCLYFSKGKCGICQKVCTAGAIDYEQKDTIETIDFDAIIVAAGAEEYTPRIRPEYGYGIYDNVVTSIEYERILSASGPTGGHIIRPSDKTAPGRIAFIQCVGSRDISSGNYAYCSSYCCMQATKDAIITREHDQNACSTIFYIDIRAFGKDFDKFVDRAQSEYNVKYIKSRISEIIEEPKTKNLVIKYITPDGRINTKEFELIVLSVGIRISDQIKELMTELGVKLSEYGFCPCDAFEPGITNVDGIYVCGTLMGPMDIPETVMSASAAASMAARGLLSPEISSEIIKEKPDEIDIEEKYLKIGVVVCHCGVNIGSVVDVPEVVKFAGSFRNVVFADELIYACSRDSIKYIIDKIKEHDLTRFIMAACSPRTHETLFKSALEEAGLNKYLMQMTNIRDQCSWVHQDNHEEATEKAKDLVCMAVGRSRYLQPLHELDSEVNKACLVIGGGIAGMMSALFIADNGFRAFLVEKDTELGGNLLKINYTLEEKNISWPLGKIRERVQEHPLIDVCLNTEIREIKGYVGNFTTNLTSGKEERNIEHGAVIVATGGREHETESYGYRDESYVVTQREFETMLLNKNPMLKYAHTVAMIQCVDSRESDKNYCSRVCCGEMVKNILRLKNDYPGKDVYVLYRDIRTYGMLEPYYTQARKTGALFFRYDIENKPVIQKEENGEFIITVYDEILRRYIKLRAQLIVLSVGIDPLETNDQLARMLKVPLNEDGFFHEAHVKLRPVDFATDGIFVSGLAHGPKYINESVSQAIAAASRALTIITKDKIRSEAHTAVINEVRCTGCGFCVDVCAYNAIEIDKEKNIAAVNTLMCKGCGSCAATCLSGAVDLSGFTNKQLIQEFQELFL